MFATVWGALAFTLVLRAAHATPALAQIASADDVPPAHLPNVIRIHGLRFDISKLISATPLSVWKSESTPPTRTTLEYRLNLQGPLKHNATVAEGRQCPEGTWMCFRKWNSILDTKNSSRLLQVVPVASSKFIPSEEADGPSVLESHDHLNASFTLGEQHWREKHPPLVIQLHGGMYASQKQSATLALICDEEIDDVSKPTVRVAYETWGWHVLEWRTKYACPTNGWSSHKHDPKPDARIPGSPTGAPGGGAEREHPLHGSGSPAKSVWFWIGTALFVLTIAHVLLRFIRSGGRIDIASIISALASLPQALLHLPSTMGGCLSRKRPTKRPEHAQLLWAADDGEDGGLVVGARDSMIPGFLIDETDVDDLSSLSSPSRSKFSSQYPPTYGIATPRTSIIANDAPRGGSGIRGAVGKAVDFVKSKF